MKALCLQDQEELTALLRLRTSEQKSRFADWENAKVCWAVCMYVVVDLLYLVYKLLPPARLLYTSLYMQ